MAELAARTPLLPGADTLVFVDVDSVQRRVYGGTKQGAAFGHAKIASKSLLVRGLNVLAATVSTPLAAPVVAAARLRGGNAGSARGTATLMAEAITTARHAGATGLIVVRADSAYYAGAFVAACRRNRARFSVTVRMDPKVKRAVATITDDAWTPIKYPNAIGLPGRADVLTGAQPVVEDNFATPAQVDAAISCCTRTWFHHEVPAPVFADRYL